MEKRMSTMNLRFINKEEAEERFRAIEAVQGQEAMISGHRCSPFNAKEQMQAMRVELNREDVTGFLHAELFLSDEECPNHKTAHKLANGFAKGCHRLQKFEALIQTVKTEDGYLSQLIFNTVCPSENRLEGTKMYQDVNFYRSNLAYFSFLCDTMLDAPGKKLGLEVRSYLAGNVSGLPRVQLNEEAQALVERLADNDMDESDFLRCIDEYRFEAGNGQVVFREKTTRTYLDVSTFSHYYNRINGAYWAPRIDADGKPGNGNHWITDRRMNQPSIHMGDAKAWGSVFIYSDASKPVREKVLKAAEEEIRHKCREHFGIWGTAKREPDGVGPVFA